MSPAMIEPELNGRPMVLTKKISETLKSLKAFGSKSLKIKSNIAAEITFARINVFAVTVL